MLISGTLKLIDASLPYHQGKGHVLTLFKGKTPIAPYIGLMNGKNLIALGLIGSSCEDQVREDLCYRPAWRRATFQEATVDIKSIEALELWGTPFQVKVWKALYELPGHQTTTYKEIAKKVGYNNGFQAIGQAISHNPISLLIPCHLVIKTSGEMGDYYWGSDLKAKLLEAKIR